MTVKYLNRVEPGRPSELSRETLDRWLESAERPATTDQRSRRLPQGSRGDRKQLNQAEWR